MNSSLIRFLRRAAFASPALLATLACSLSISAENANSAAQAEPVAAVTVVTRVEPVTQVVPVTRVILVTKRATPEGEPASQMWVLAYLPWQDSDVSVDPDDMVTVRYLSGEWTGGIGAGLWYDGRGDLTAKYKCVEHYPPNDCDEPMPNVYNGTLVGRVGDSIFEIADYLQFHPREAGDLLLRMNDHDEGLFDNQGELTVEVAVQR